MVEEHSANLTTRIDPEYLSSTPTPAREASDCKRSDCINESPLINEIVDNPVENEPKKETSVNPTTNPIETKRSKSLSSANPTEPNEDNKIQKEAVKKSKSVPTRAESEEPTTEITECDDDEPSMTIEESTSPNKDRITPDSQSLGRPESPKPGCSSQQDFGKYLCVFLILQLKIKYLTLHT